MVLNLRTPKFRNFTFAELREDVVVIHTSESTLLDLVCIRVVLCILYIYIYISK